MNTTLAPRPRSAPSPSLPVSESPSLAPGTYPARCSALIDLGTHSDAPSSFALPHSSFPAKPGRLRRLVLLTFTITLPDGRTQRQSRQFPVSCDVRAGLARFLTPWLGSTWFRGDRKQALLNPLAITEQPGLLTLVESEAINPRTGKPWLNIAGIAPVCAGLTVPDLRFPATLFTLRRPDRTTFLSLPAWIQTKIRHSTEWQTLRQTSH